MAFGSSLPARIPEWAGVGTTYYVDDAAGDDSRTETQAQSEATPWLTIQKAIDSYVLPATGHVRILVKNGTYQKTGSTNIRDATVKFSNLGSRTPTPSHVLHLLAYPGHTPTINEYQYVGTRDDITDLTAIWFDDSSATYIRVRGFLIDFSITEANSTWQTHAISFDSGSSHCEIDQCEVRDFVAGNTGISPQSVGIYTNGASSYIHLYNLDVHNIGTNTGYEGFGGSHPFYIGGGNQVVANCLGYDNPNGYGLQLYQGGGGGPNCFVVNCVFANNPVKSGATVYGTFTNVVIRNCIFYDNGEYGFRADNGATVSLENCITRLNGLAGNLGNGYNAQSATLTLADNLVSDPLFVNYASRDFHLQGGSPAIGAGEEPYNPPTDLEGTSYSTPTIGSYVGTAASAPPTNIIAPTVSGVPTESEVLSSSTGTWTGSSPITFTYQWRRCNSSGASCSDIGGATSATYTLTSADVGSTIRCRVTATSPEGSASADSAATSVVGGRSGGSGSPPVNTTAPSISGTPIVGYTLTASTGVWTGDTPMTFTYQWQRCNSAGANCTNISGATGSTHLITTGDIGYRLRVRVTATN